MRKQTLSATSHSVYELRYHIIFCTKYRRRILTGELKEFAEKQLHKICGRNRWTLHALAVQPEHIHIVVSAPPKVAPLVIATTLKSLLGLYLVKSYPQLKRQFPNSGPFSRGTYYGSVGKIGQDTVQSYVERQS
jgi:putative transposase